MSRPQWMQLTRRLGAVVLAVVFWFVALPAHAAAADSSAETLFKMGRDLMESGNYALACGKFAESQRLEPRVGTALNLALCHQERGMLVQSLRTWREAEQLARKLDDNRLEFARQQAAAMEPRVPLLTLTIHERAPAGTVVRWSDSYQQELQTVASAQLGKPIQVNAGTVRVQVDAPDREPRTYQLAMAEHDRKQIVVEAGPLGAGASPSGGDGGESGDVGDPEPSSGSSAMTITGFVVGGVGLVGLGLGGVFAGIAASKDSESTEADASGSPPCDDASYCSAEGFELREDAITAAHVSTAAFIIGGALAATGLVLVLVAPDGDPSSADEGETALSQVHLSVGPARASLQITW